jgi:hypothetical protein
LQRAAQPSKLCTAVLTNLNENDSCLDYLRIVAGVQAFFDARGGALAARIAGRASKQGAVWSGAAFSLPQFAQ